MFKFLFYFFGLIAILYEYWSVSNYPKLDAFRKKIGTAKKDRTNPKITGAESTFAVLHLLYFLWVLVGLFTSQWEVFILIFILTTMNHWLKGELWNLIDSIITIALILFAILNTYHWHIKVYKFVLDFYTGN